MREVSIKEVLKIVVPLYNTHWFAYTFLVLYIIMPYLNILADILEKNDFKLLLASVFIGWSLIYTLTGADMGYSNLGWFIFVYLLGAYIRLYNIRLSTNKVKLLMVFSAVVLILSCVIINVIGINVGFYPKHGTHLLSLHSPFILLLGISMFLHFQMKDYKRITAINIIASSSFGIYLISDNPLIRNWIWNVLFFNAQFSNSNLLIIIGIGEALLIMALCTAIDLIFSLCFSCKWCACFLSFFEKSILNTKLIILNGKLNKQELPSK